MKGSLAVILRNVVKNFDLSDFHYPINTTPSKPVLLISDYPDLERPELLEKKLEKEAVEKKIYVSS